MLRVKVPPVRGVEDPYRSHLWTNLATTSDRLQTLIVERCVGGRSQRDMAMALEQAGGQCVLSHSAVSPGTDTLRQEDEAFRTRDLRGDDVASLCVDTVDASGRRWGSKTGVLCVWGLGVEGRKVFLTLATTKSESDESCLEVGRDLLKRGLQTPVTITTDGAPGRIKAIDAMWPRALRMRCWFHKLQHLAPQVPPQAWPACKALVADLRDAPTFDEGQRRFHHLIEPYQATCPEACRCVADESAASLHHLQVPRRHRQYVRTSNLAARAFEAERRRTTVIPHLWDDASGVQRVFAGLIRGSARWGKKQ